MGSFFSSEYFGLDPREVEQLQMETGFSNRNIRRLFERFQHLDKERKGFLTKQDFMSIPEVCIF